MTNRSKLTATIGLATLCLSVALSGCADPSSTSTSTPGPAAPAGSATSTPPSATPATTSGAAHPVTPPPPPPSLTLPPGTPSGPAPSGSPTQPAAPSPSVVPPNPAPTKVPAASVVANLKLGSKGSEVVALQNRLNQLGFWVGPADGDFGGQTRQAVIAAQKAAGIPTDGVVGPITATALSRGITLKSRAGGTGLEVDKARQLLLVVQDGNVVRFYNTSTGGNYTYWNPGSGRYETAETPSGTFTVGRSVEGWDPGYL
ncbi:MAG: peptidoglycan-binding protein, partial [Propionibacteriaceae bacterium]|nr:peptidoglycan-binding protein [Propionibacteriaceae bacterium]